LLKGFRRLQLLLTIGIGKKLNTVVEFEHFGSESTAAKVVLLLQLPVHGVSDFVSGSED